MPRFDPERHARRHEGDLEQLREYYGARPPGRRVRFPRPTSERGGNAAGWMMIGLGVTLAAVAVWAAFAAEAGAQDVTPMPGKEPCKVHLDVRNICGGGSRTWTQDTEIGPVRLKWTTNAGCYAPKYNPGAEPDFLEVLDVPPGYAPVPPALEALEGQREVVKLCKWEGT